MQRQATLARIVATMCGSVWAFSDIAAQTFGQATGSDGMGGSRGSCGIELGLCGACCDDATYRIAKIEDWSASSREWEHDLRPVGVITLFWGEYRSSVGGNMRGANPYWWGRAGGNPGGGNDASYDDGDADSRPEAFDWLLAELDAMYARGYRRFLLYLPAGRAYTNNYGAIPAFAAAQWGGMPEWRRTWFSTVGTDASDRGVKGWLQMKEHEDCEISIYQGFFINRPCSMCTDDNIYSSATLSSDIWYFPCDDETTTFHVPDSLSIEDCCNLDHTVRDWSAAGITSVWWDAATTDEAWDEYRQFNGYPCFEGYKLGAEPFPMDSCSVYPCRVDLRETDLDQGPFIMTMLHAETDYVNGAQNISGTPDGRHSWDVHGIGAECVLLIRGLPSYKSTFVHCQPAGNCSGNDDWNDLDEPAPGWGPGEIYDTIYRAYVSKGFILTSSTDDNYAYSPTLDPTYGDFAERLYGFGIVKNPADFNGDGDYDWLDDQLFNCRWEHAQEFYKEEYKDAVLTFYHGDVNGDGVVDNDDLTEWADITNLLPAQIDLGTMDWDPNAGQYVARYGDEWPWDDDECKK